jgi:hypothetical protein
MGCSLRSVQKRCGWTGGLREEPAGRTTVGRTIPLSLARVLSSRASLRFAGHAELITATRFSQARKKNLNSPYQPT